MCGAANTPELEAAIGPRVKAELLKDAQVEAVTVNVVPSGGALDRTWAITIDAQTAVGPFELVLAVGDVTVEILGLAA